MSSLLSTLSFPLPQHTPSPQSLASFLSVSRPRSKESIEDVFSKKKNEECRKANNKPFQKKLEVDYLITT
jgi:hypothetical protein